MSPHLYLRAANAANSKAWVARFWYEDLCAQIWAAEGGRITDEWRDCYHSAVRDYTHRTRQYARFWWKVEQFLASRPGQAPPSRREEA